MQDSTTANMVFGVAEIIAYITQTITLEPGDLIATGTPAGVGAFRKPPVCMKPGDEITIEIDGLGSLTNPVTPPDVGAAAGGRRSSRGCSSPGWRCGRQIVGVGPLIPAIQDDLDISHAVAGLLGTIPVLCMGLFALPAPALTPPLRLPARDRRLPRADRRLRRRARGRAGGGRRDHRSRSASASGSASRRR